MRVIGQCVERLAACAEHRIAGASVQTLQQRLPEICFGPAASMSESASAKRWNSYAAMGLSDQQAGRILRISIGWTTSEEELQQALQLIAAAHEGLAEDSV